MNKYKLLYLIRERGYTTESFCKEIGISLSSFSKRLNMHVEFSRNEILKIITVLGLSNDEVIDIFFAKKVS